MPTGSQNMEENPAPSGRRPDAGVGWGAALGPRPPPPAACSPGGPRLRRRPCDPAGPEGAAQHRSRPDTAWAPERARLARTQGPQPECTARPPNELGLGASAPASASRLTRRRALRCWATLQWGRRSPRGPPRTPQHARPPVPRTWRGCRPQAAPRDPSAGPPLGAASQSLQTGGPVPHGPVGAGAERGRGTKGTAELGRSRRTPCKVPGQTQITLRDEVQRGASRSAVGGGRGVRLGTDSARGPAEPSLHTSHGVQGWARALRTPRALRRPAQRPTLPESLARSPSPRVERFAGPHTPAAHATP